MATTPKKATSTATTAAEATAPADTLAPATDVAASGALIEPTIVDRIDTKHPAVDDEPRKGLPADSNRIDFNDPHLTGGELFTKPQEEQREA